MSEPTVFLPFDDLDLGHENRLTGAFLSLLRISPVAHLTFLDLVRDAQAGCQSFPAIRPSSLLSQQVEIRTQEGHLDIESGNLVSVAITAQPWSTNETVVPTADRRIYDGVLYYGDDWVIILENKPQIPPPDDDLRREIKPNLPAGVDLNINAHVVNLVWRDVILRMQLLARTGILHGPEETILQDFREYVHRRYPHLNPYATFSACGGSAEALKERCGEILAAIAPGRVMRDVLGNPYIDVQSSKHPIAGRIYLLPKEALPDSIGRAERICLRVYPALTIPQAREFYGDNAPELTSFLALRADEWKVVPLLDLRFREKIQWERELPVDPEVYFSFWRTQILSGGFRGNVPLSEAFGTAWAGLVTARIVKNEDRDEAQAAFRPGQTVNFCPGWSLEYSWSLGKAEELDDQPGTGGRFVQVAKKKVEEAYRAMGRYWPPDWRE